MTTKSFLCVPLIIFILLSCGKTPCDNSIGLRFAFVHFTRGEADTVLLKKYVKGGNFSTVIDSVLIDTSLLKLINRNDTLFPSALHINILLQQKFDYKVQVPGIGKTYLISDIKEEELKMKHPLFGAGPDCFNPITSYTLDGKPQPVPLHHEIVYFTK